MEKFQLVHWTELNEAEPLSSALGAIEDALFFAQSIDGFVGGRSSAIRAIKRNLEIAYNAIQKLEEAENDGN